MNEISLIGRVANKPEIIKFSNGKKMANFLLAIQVRKFQNFSVSTKINWKKIVGWDRKAQLMNKRPLQGCFIKKSINKLS